MRGWVCHVTGGGVFLVAAALALAAALFLAALARAADGNVGLLTAGGTAACEGCNQGSYNGAPYCYDADALFDGRGDRRVGCTFTAKITRSWPEAVSVSAVRFYSYGDMGWAPRYTLYVSPDGTNWTQVAQGIARQRDWTAVTFPEVTARHLRLHLWSTDNWVYSTEVEIHGRPACTAEGGCARVEATVGEELSLDLSGGFVSFGAVAPSASPRLVPGAVAVTVRANVPWGLRVAGVPPRLVGGTAALPPTDFREGAADFVPFPEQPTVMVAGGPTAGEIHVHDYRQRVPFTAPPGRYEGSVTYQLLAR